MPSASHRPCPHPPRGDLDDFRRRLREPRPAHARTKAEWLQSRIGRREALQVALGLAPLPDRLSLDQRHGPRVEGDGHTVEAVYWRTWPQVWAEGALYRPHPLPAERGAALLALGFAESDVPANLARRGHVVLCVNPIEVADWAVGLSPATIAVLSSLRGLDLLGSLPEVDRERLGVCGAGCGAQHALYVMALDERPRAAALALTPACFRRGLPSDAACELCGAAGLAGAVGPAELAALSSPRGVLYLTGSGPWTPAFDLRELPELRAVFRLWQQPDRLGHRHFPDVDPFAGPQYEAACEWLEQELGAKGGPAHAPGSMSAASGECPPPDNEGGPGIRRWYHRRVVAQPPQLESRASRRSYQDRLREDLLALLGGEPAPVGLEAEVQSGGGGVQDVSFRSEVDVRLPALFAPGRPGAPVLVAAHPDGKEAALDLPLARDARTAGWAVLAPDLRFRGALKVDLVAESLAAGRPEAALAAQDLRACATWLSGRDEVDWRGIALYGIGDLGVPALLAGAWDERVAAVMADCCGTLYRDGGPGLPVLPNILRLGDVPQIASLLAPRALWLYGVAPDRVGFSSRRYFDWVKRTYQSLGELDALRLTVDGLPEGPGVLEWLTTRLRRQRKGRAAASGSG